MIKFVQGAWLVHVPMLGFNLEVLPCYLTEQPLTLELCHLILGCDASWRDQFMFLGDLFYFIKVKQCGPSPPKSGLSPFPGMNF